MKWLSVQDGDGDAFVAAVEVAVGAQFGAAFDGIAGILLKDTPFFTKNDAGDEAFLFAEKEGLAQGRAQSTAFSRGTVAMNDFDGDDAGLFGLAEFGEETAASLVDGGQTSFEIEGLKCGHGGPEGIVPEGEGQLKCVGRRRIEGNHTREEGRGAKEC